MGLAQHILKQAPAQARIAWSNPTQGKEGHLDNKLGKSVAELREEVEMLNLHPESRANRLYFWVESE